MSARLWPSGTPGSAFTRDISFARTQPDKPHDEHSMKLFIPRSRRYSEADSRFAAQGPGDPPMRYDSLISAPNSFNRYSSGTASKLRMIFPNASFWKE